MQFSMLTFINNDLGDAVETIHNSGVDVKGIIENIYYFGSEYNGLKNAGVDVHSHFSKPHFLHHKYGIVDANNSLSDPLVITGSHNWTNSAENDYDENTLIIHDAVIANMYYEEFMARYAQITNTTRIEGQEQTQVRVFPNPIVNTLNIESKSPIKDIKIINSLGQSVYIATSLNHKNLEIDLSFLSSGLFYLAIELDKTTIIHKINTLK